MASRLSPDDLGLQLLENAAATAGALIGLTLMFGAVSGAHFNPAVTLVDRLFGTISTGDAVLYAMAQTAGGCIGAVANVMFELDPINLSTKVRSSGAAGVLPHPLPLPARRAARREGRHRRNRRGRNGGHRRLVADGRIGAGRGRARKPRHRRHRQRRRSPDRAGDAGRCRHGARPDRPPRPRHRTAKPRSSDWPTRSRQSSCRS